MSNLASKPLLKWVGGKSQLLPAVLAAFPRDMGDYYEPFVGGGAVLLGVLAERAAGRITIDGAIHVSDLNPHLINFYKVVQTQPEPFITAVAALQSAYAAAPPLAEGATPDRDPADATAAASSQEAYYYWTRKRFNALAAPERTGPTAAALFYFLNRTCFRGVYREGPRGFNVPFGHYRATQILDAEHVRAVSSALVDAGVQFTVSDFSVPLAAAGGPQDHIYLDPPYLPITATSFTGYTADGFDAAQHEALFAAARAAGARGATFLLSNADAPVLATAFPAPAYRTLKVSARRAIHSKDPGATAMEVLIRNY